MIVVKYLFWVTLGVLCASMYGSWLAERDTKLLNVLKERNEMICKQFTHHPDCP